MHSCVVPNPSDDEASQVGYDTNNECSSGLDEGSLADRRSPSLAPSSANAGLTSVSSTDSLSSYAMCPDFEELASPSIPTPWYLAPTPSPVIPYSESFEFELSFYSAVGGNESLIDDEDLAALFPSGCTTKSFPDPEDRRLLVSHTLRVWRP